MGKLRIAQIGVGYWGPNLLRNLVSNDKCDVRVVADLSKERRDYVTGLYPQIDVTHDVNSILRDRSIDAVIISTPVSTHFELVIKTLESDKHVLIEKPMATSVHQVDKIQEIARAKNKIVMSGHTFIFNNAVRTIKNILDSGEIGEIRYIHCKRVNLGRIRNDIDAMWNFAPHDISILHYLLDEPEPINVTKVGMDYVQKGIDDVVFINIKYPNNILANIHVSWLDPQKLREITIVGSKKMVIYDDIAENKVSIYNKGIDRMSVLGDGMDFDNPNLFSFSYRSGDVYIPSIDWAEPLSLEIAHFIDCIMNNNECITGIDHSRRVIKVLEMAG